MYLFKSFNIVCTFLLSNYKYCMVWQNASFSKLIDKNIFIKKMKNISSVNNKDDFENMNSECE